MKLQKIRTEDKKASIDRKFLSKIGDSIYHNSEVRAVHMKIIFRDNTRLEYKRTELMDHIEKEMLSENNSEDDDE